MQTLWSRAASARSFCNCSACVAATKGIARRAGKPPFRQCVPRPEAFGLVTSTLVFSAAVFDSARKDSKLREWDKILKDTNAEIEAIDQAQQTRLQRLADLDFDGLEEQSDTSGLPQRIWWDQATWGDMLGWQDMQEKQRLDAGFGDYQGVPLKALQSLPKSDLQRLLKSKRVLNQFYGGASCSSLSSVPHLYPLSTKKLKTLEWSHLKLVTNVLATVDVRGAEAAQVLCSTGDDPNEDRALEDMENMERRIKSLRSEDKASDLYTTFPTPLAPNFRFSPCERDEELRAFNDTLSERLTLIEQPTKESVINLCRQLIRLQIAPNIHTYNLLLIRFCELREPQLVDAVLESLLETHTKPNEITHASVLRFFTVTSNRERFSLYLRKMNGMSRGLAVANPNLPIDGIAKSRYRQLGSKAVELARLNGEVYTSLIKGMIKMFRLDEAKWYYIKMINEGWKPSVELLTELLKSCCQSLDIVSGWRIWKSLSQQQDEVLHRDAYELMLRLCKGCEKLHLFEHIFQQGVKAGTLPQEAYESVGQSGDATVMAGVQKDRTRLYSFQAPTIRLKTSQQASNDHQEKMPSRANRKTLKDSAGRFLEQPPHDDRDISPQKHNQMWPESGIAKPKHVQRSSAFDDTLGLFDASNDEISEIKRTRSHAWKSFNSISGKTDELVQEGQLLLRDDKEGINDAIPTTFDELDLDDSTDFDHQAYINLRRSTIDAPTQLPQSPVSVPRTLTFLQDMSQRHAEPMTTRMLAEAG